jgi:hypothetical protein
VDLVAVISFSQTSSVASACNDEQENFVNGPSTPTRAHKRSRLESATDVPGGFVLQTPPRNNFILDDEDDGGGKMTQEELSDNKLIAQIFDVGLLMQHRGEVGISMRLATASENGDQNGTITYTHPAKFQSLNYRQQQFIIELMKEEMNGRYAGGKFVLGVEELSYAESLGFQHRDLLSVANFACLYMADSMSCENYYQSFSTVCDSSVSHFHPVHPSPDSSAANAPTPVHANSLKNKQPLTNNEHSRSYPKLHPKPSAHYQSPFHHTTRSSQYASTIRDTELTATPRPITIHGINISSPMRDVIGNRPPKELNPHFSGVQKDVSAVTVVEFKSEGEFVVQVTKHEFEDLFQVNADTDADGDVSVEYLAWRSQPSKFIRTTKLNRLLMKDPRFANHIDARFDRSGRVSAAVNFKNKDKKRRPTKATHNWAVWQHGHCSHQQNEHVPCPCTFDFGFKLDDINDLYRESRETISMSGVIHNNCQHERHKLYDRCAGIDRQQLRHEYAFSNSVFTGVDSKQLYNNHNMRSPTQFSPVSIQNSCITSMQRFCMPTSCEDRLCKRTMCSCIYCINT